MENGKYTFWRKDTFSQKGGIFTSKKVYPNDPCPCGSGKKHKLCCKRKQDDADFVSPLNLLDNYKLIRKESRIKQCLHPNNEECSEKIIGAHSIQNNKILKRISSNGMVVMPCPKPDNPFAPMTSYGRKEATVFTGFCGYHDKTLFQPIEDRDFEKTEEQVFLYTYRCFALEYHKKQEVKKMEQIIFAKRPSLVNMPDAEDPFKGNKMAIEDFIEDKKIFDKAILEKDYSVLGHAEINAIEQATRKLKRWNLSDCELYVSLEPCSMCKEIIKQTRLKKVYYLLSKPDSKKEYDKTQFIKLESNSEQTYANILSDFFEKKR